MQVKILSRTMKVKSEHHKVSGSSSAKAHWIRAANLPSHRLSEIQRSEVVRSAGGKLSPIGYSCHRKPASMLIVLLAKWAFPPTWRVLDGTQFTPGGSQNFGSLNFGEPVGWQVSRSYPMSFGG